MPGTVLCNLHILFYLILIITLWRNPQFTNEDIYQKVRKFSTRLYAYYMLELDLEHIILSSKNYFLLPRWWDPLPPTLTPLIIQRKDYKMNLQHLDQHQLFVLIYTPHPSIFRFQKITVFPMSCIMTYCFALSNSVTNWGLYTY